MSYLIIKMNKLLLLSPGGTFLTKQKMINLLKFLKTKKVVMFII